MTFLYKLVEHEAIQNFSGLEGCKKINNAQRRLKIKLSKIFYMDTHNECILLF